MIVLVIIILLLLIVALYPIVRDMLRKHRETVPAYVEGLQLVLDHEPEKALVRLKQAVDKDPNNIDAYIRLGNILIEQGEVERGVWVHENLGLRRNLKPEDERNVLRALARDYLATDRKLKAASSLEELLRLDPRDAQSAEKLFHLYIETASWDKCDALLKELSRRLPDRTRLAVLCAELGRARSRSDPAAARDYLEQALRLDRNSIEARLYLGDLNMSERKTEEAIRLWTEALELAPAKNALVRSRLEAAYYESGRYDEIPRVYEQLLRKVPADEGLAVALAGIYGKREESAKAVRLLERYTRPESGPGLYLSLAMALLKQGNTERAIRALEQAADKLGQVGTRTDSR